MIKSLLESYDNDYDVEMAPICDGGEYTFDTLKYYFDCSVETIFATNPYGKKVETRYLIKDDTAFVISSEILHLDDTEEEYKNPLELTDYGLGEIIKDAINKGFKKINICLGGTSTTCAGIGMRNALLNKEIIKCKDLENLTNIEIDKKKYKDISVNVICDGIPSAKEMDIVTRLKIGQNFKEKEEDILAQINKGIKHISELTKNSLDTDFTGAAGAIRLGIDSLFDAKYYKGAEYFYNLFGIDEKIKGSDIVITGEGRLDNPKWEKTPVTISKKAKEYNKRVVFLSGLYDESWIKSKGFVIEDEELKKIGVDVLISSQGNCKNKNIPKEKLKEYYRRTSEEVFKKYLKRVINDTGIKK